jgi:mannose-6-phosphate isomerase-like protein (cupin superfamily)
MTVAPDEIMTGEHFSSTQIGEFENLDRYKFAHAKLPFEVEGKVFLNSLLGLTSAEISINKLPPKASMPFHHRHRSNEEIYIFIKGTGEFRVDDELFPIQEGTVIRVAPEGVRCWRNLSDEPLYYVVVQSREGSHGNDRTIEDGEAVMKPVVW